MKKVIKILFILSMFSFLPYVAVAQNNPFDMLNKMKQKVQPVEQKEKTQGENIQQPVISTQQNLERPIQKDYNKVSGKITALQPDRITITDKEGVMHEYGELLSKEINLAVGMDVIIGLMVGADGNEYARTIEIIAQANASSNNTYIELKTAMYGIPLGADLQEVIKWCGDNKCQISTATPVEYNNTKEEFNALLESNKKRAKFLKEEYKDIYELENEIRMKLANNEIKDIVDVTYANNILRAIEGLKSPSFEYQNNERYLAQVFYRAKQLRPDIPHSEQIANEMIDNIYLLYLTPAEALTQSDCVKKIKVYFYQNKAKQLKSYAAEAFYKSDDEDKLYKQANIIIDALNQKYGQPEIPMLISGLPDNPHSTEEAEERGRLYPYIKNGLVFISGWNQVPGGVRIWGKNIDLALGIGGDSFILVYYEPNIGKEMVEENEIALQKKAESEKSEEQKQREKAKNNF